MLCGIGTYSESVSSILTNDNSKSSAVDVNNSYNGKTQKPLIKCSREYNYN